MNDQRVTVDGTADQSVDAPDGAAAVGTDGSSDAPLAPLFDAPMGGRDAGMKTPDPIEEAPAASLVGSLSVFTLSDVLSMLAATGQTGELQVVSDAVDGKLWLEDGQFSNAHVGAASTIGQAVFELACVAEGWFYFTAGLSSSSGQPAVPVAAVLDEVRPQVEEWRDLREVVPLEAVVALSPTPPGQDVQIRSDQWRVLTTVGTAGHSVKTVIEQIGGDQIVGLRTLHELQSAGLIVLDAPPPDSEPSGAQQPFGADGDRTPVTPLPTPPSLGYTDERLDDLAPPPPPGLDPAVNAEDRFGSLAEVAIMPPPIAGDPWAASATASTTTAEAGGSANGSGNGSGDHGVA
jgi:hypothetical protein